MDYKIIFAILSSIIGIVSFLPYLKDIFQRKTRPHVYTWFIWGITQGTAVMAIWKGGGGIGALELTIGTMLVFVVFLFSLQYGTKNITKIDTVVLISAMFAIFVWWKLENPVLAVFMVSAIDLLGYIPSFRKTFQEPWSETLSTWIGFSIGNWFAILALREYNLLTVTYLVAITSANIIIALICIIRRPVISKSLLTTRVNKNA